MITTLDELQAELDSGLLDEEQKQAWLRLLFKLADRVELAMASYPAQDGYISNDPVYQAFLPYFYGLQDLFGIPLADKDLSVEAVARGLDMGWIDARIEDLVRREAVRAWVPYSSPEAGICGPMWGPDDFIGPPIPPPPFIRTRGGIGTAYASGDRTTGSLTGVFIVIIGGLLTTAIVIALLRAR